MVALAPDDYVTDRAQLPLALATAPTTPTM